MKKFRIVSLVLCLVMIFSLAGCGEKPVETTQEPAATTEPSEAPEKTEAQDTEAAADPLRVYEGTTLNLLLEGHSSSNALKALAPEFEELTGIKVNLEILPYEEMQQKIILAFNQGSTDYDIVMNDRYNTISYKENGYILPLNDYMADESLNMFVDVDDFVPKYYEACQIDGTTWGLPVYGESTFLMYRKDIFDQFDLEVPQTVEELVEDARVIYEGTDGEVAGITMRGQQGIHVLYTWAGFLWGNGGRWFDENGKLDLATPEAIESAQVYADLLANYGPKGYANFGWQENRLLFQEGKAAMTIDATVNGAFCEDPSESKIVGKVGYAPVPAFEGAELQGGQHSLSVHELYLSAFSKNPEAAFLFMTWATSKDVQSKSMDVESHCGISSVGAMESPAFQEKYGAFKDGMLAAIDQANVDYTPQNQYAQEIINRVGIAMSEVLAGTKTAEEALTAVNDEVNTEVLP